MFSGMTNHSIDAKGRIVLPAKFREQLGETYYLARGFGNKCIQVMSSEQFNAMCEKILALPANLSMAVQYTFNATAVEVTPNAQGRVIIPQSLREFAEIEGDAVVIGMTNRLEIWSKKNFLIFLSFLSRLLTLLPLRKTAFMLTAQRAEAVTAVKSSVDLLRASSFRLIRIPMQY